MQPGLRRPRRRHVVVAVLAVAGALAAGSGASAIASGRAPAPRATGPLGTDAAPAAGTVVRGTVERVAVEGSDLVEHARGPGGRVTAANGLTAHAHGPGEAPAVLAFLRSGDRRVQVRAGDLAGVPTGSLVEARLGSARAASGASPGSSAGTSARTTNPTVLAAGGSRARSVRVVRRGAAPRTAAVPRRAAAPATAAHQVTVALAVPPGGTKDAATPAGVAAVVGGGVSRFWSQASAGRVSFTVTAAHGWITTTAACTQPFALWAEVKRRTGFVEGPGRHLVVYLTSQGTGSCYYGLGTVGSGTSSGGYVYVRDATTSILAHELGHNLGLGHSNELQCPGVADGAWAGGWTPSCRQAGYRDWYDVMGISWDRLGSLSTAHAYALGLLPQDAVESVGAPVSAELAPVSATAGLRSLRVVDPAGPTYVVEYRAATGRDAYLAGNWAGLRPGVVVRRADPTDATQTLLLDLTPSWRDGWDDDLDTPLAAGATFTTASGRVVLRVDEATAALARVSVAVDGVWPENAFDRAGGRIHRPRPSVDPNPSATATSDPGGRVGRTGAPDPQETPSPVDPTQTADPTATPSGTAEPTGTPDPPSESPTPSTSDSPPADGTPSAG